MIIKIDDLTGNRIKDLLEEHLAGMKANTPAESIHALDINALRAPDITFWSAWDENGELLGCAALKRHNAQLAELKSMRTSSKHLRKGVAKQLLQHVISFAKQQNYQRISLETGAINDFKPARTLYASFGFNDCEPFADYTNDPNSVFMSLALKMENFNAP